MANTSGSPILSNAAARIEPGSSGRAAAPAVADTVVVGSAVMLSRGVVTMNSAKAMIEKDRRGYMSTDATSVGERHSKSPGSRSVSTRAHLVANRSTVASSAYLHQFTVVAWLVSAD